jgi:Mg2+ and Co2+ transporter CorA
MKIDHFKERETVKDLIAKLEQAYDAVRESSYYLDEEDKNMFNETKEKLDTMISRLSAAVTRFDRNMSKNQGYFNL